MAQHAQQETIRRPLRKAKVVGSGAHRGRINELLLSRLGKLQQPAMPGKQALDEVGQPHVTQLKELRFERCLSRSVLLPRPSADLHEPPTQSQTRQHDANSSHANSSHQKG